MKKRKLLEEVEYYNKKEQTLRKNRLGLSEAFLRPPYQYTSLQNDTVAKRHEDDWRL